MMTPLAGTTVLELGTMITAALAGMMLGDLGADVVKVERPGEGDPFRSFRGGLYSPHFVAFNRNKRSVELDLQSQEGRDLLLQMVETADVLLENYRPDVLPRLGLGPDVLRARNPRLIHCSITGFGQTGPYRRRPAYDTVGQALSGIASLAVDPHEPRITGATIPDNITGMYAGFGIVAALCERARTGQGRRVEVNMLEASTAFIPDAFMNYEMLKLMGGPFTRVSSSQSYVVRCKDGKLVALHLSSPTKFWDNLLKAIDSPELSNDPRFKTRDQRIDNYLELVNALGREFERRDRAEWLGRLTENDVPSAPVQNIEEVLADPQLEAMQSFRELPLATGGSVRSMQIPITFDGQRPSAWTAPPALGQHTQDYLASVRADSKSKSKAKAS